MSNLCHSPTPNSGGSLSSLYAAMMPLLLRATPADLDAMAAAAYDEGLIAGAAQAEAEFAAERALLTAAREALGIAAIVDGNSVRGIFITLVRSLAEAVVAGELKLSPEIISRLVDTALATVTSTGDLVIRVHPDAIRHLGHTAIADPALDRGAVVVEGASFVVADSLNARLAALIEGLL